MTLDEIVSTYIRECRPRVRAEMCFFETLPSLTAATSNAVRPGGRKHDHQFRIPPALLDEAERRLRAAAGGLAQASDFAAFHRLVESEIRTLRGIGDLAVYDVAHRLGAFLGKVPALVYLHCGTKKGAAILGFRGKALDPKLLPPAFSRLTAAEIEDCLCIYKDQLRSGAIRIRHMQRSTTCSDAGSVRMRKRKVHPCIMRHGEKELTVEDILEEDITPPFRVILSNRVAAKIRNGIPRASAAERAGLGAPYASVLEVGGLMMGEKVGDNTFRVMDVSLTIGEPGRYNLDPAKHQAFVDDFLAKFCDEGRFGIIGSWHSHPSGNPEPSKGDLQTLKDTMAHPSNNLSFKVLLVACLDENAQLRVRGVVLTREPKVLSKIEVSIEHDETEPRPSTQ